MVAASFHLVHMGLNSKRKSGGGGEVEDEEETGGGATEAGNLEGLDQPPDGLLDGLTLPRVGLTC